MAGATMQFEGRRIGEGGRYEFERLLGQGAMGLVFLGRDHRFGRPVVLKVLTPMLAANARLRERFGHEALIQATVIHPNIVRAVDAVQDDDVLAIVLDYVEGPTLEGWLGQQPGGRATLAEAVRILAPAMAALHFAHERGVVHRDLKPSNILIDRQYGTDIPKVTDFGVAKLLGQTDGGATRPGSVLGTPTYMAPEQVKGVADVDRRADVFALGALLYHLVTGRAPFGEGSEYEITHRILSGTVPPPPSSIAAHLSPQFDAVVARAMAFDRDLRYPSAAALKVALETVAQAPLPAGAPSVLPSAPAPDSVVAPRLGPQPWQVALARTLQHWKTLRERKAVVAVSLAAMASVILVSAVVALVFGNIRTKLVFSKPMACAVTFDSGSIIRPSKGSAMNGVKLTLSHGTHWVRCCDSRYSNFACKSLPFDVHFPGFGGAVLVDIDSVNWSIKSTDTVAGWTYDQDE